MDGRSGRRSFRCLKAGERTRRSDTWRIEVTRGRGDEPEQAQPSGWLSQRGYECRRERSSGLAASSAGFCPGAE